MWEREKEREDSSISLIKLNFDLKVLLYNVQSMWLLWKDPAKCTDKIKKRVSSNKYFLCKINAFFIIGLKTYWCSYV